MRKKIFYIILLVALISFGFYQLPRVLRTPMVTVSSANPLNLPSSANFFKVTGTVKMDSIVPKPSGYLLYLCTASTCTLMDTKNLKLASQFNGTADDMIVLISDGVNWFEMSRAAN